jgi:acyl-coenzyme A thioesterase 13
MADDDVLQAPEAGYEPLFRTSAFLDATGPYYFKRQEQGFTVAVRVMPKHMNTSGTAHGGLLATLADVSLGYVTASSQNPPLRMITTSLCIDYVGSAKLGEWLEATVSIVKTGNRLAFANACIAVGANPVASAKAVFLVL